MGCLHSRPVLAHVEDATFFLGSIYSTIVSYVSHFLNRFYNLLLSPLFRLDDNVPSRLCDDRGACYRPKDRLMQKRKTDERMKRAEFAARGLDPKLALRPKESRNASTTALVTPLDEKTASSDTPLAKSQDFEKKDERPLWVMGNIAATTKEDKRRSLNTEKPRRAAHNTHDPTPADKRKRRESAPVQIPRPRAEDPQVAQYRYEVLAKSAELQRKRASPPAASLQDSLATAADRLKSNHRRSLQAEDKKQPHPAQKPHHTAAVRRPQRASPTPKTSFDIRRSIDTDAAGIQPTRPPPSSRQPIRVSVDRPAQSSSPANDGHGSSGNGTPVDGPTPRGSIADLASAAAKSKKPKDRKAWRGEISKVAKNRVSPAPGATMGRYGGSPLGGGMISSADTSPDLSTAFHAPFRAQTFA